jgi:hypothetical protein
MNHLSGLDRVPTAKEILFSRTFSELFQEKLPFFRTKLQFSRTKYTSFEGNASRYACKSIAYLSNV